MTKEGMKSHIAFYKQMMMVNSTIKRISSKIKTATEAMINTGKPLADINQKINDAVDGLELYSAESVEKTLDKLDAIK